MTKSFHCKNKRNHYKKRVASLEHKEYKASMSGFTFKQFTIKHDRCAMKVGTDGVLLGAWAQGGKRILDIGTGSGLIALMMAQRFPEAHVTGIEIDESAATQAKENAASSIYGNRIDIQNISLQEFNTSGLFDSITCNPPFFEESLRCPDIKRDTARHTESLPYSTLLEHSHKLLTPDGTLNLILPASVLPRIEYECAFASMFIIRKVFIRTTGSKPPKRMLLSISNKPTYQEEPITVHLMDGGNRSEWYNRLTSEFYL